MVLGKSCRLIPAKTSLQNSRCWTPNGDFMARYKIRQDRRNRKPLPECRLTPQEWNQYWKQLNLAVESQDEEWIYKAKAMVKEQIRSIYTNRCGRDGKCVLCAEKAGYFGLCKKCWRSLMNNAILRSQGHTRAEQQERSEKPCIVCGASQSYAVACAVSATVRCGRISSQRRNSCSNTRKPRKSAKNSEGGCFYDW